MCTLAQYIFPCLEKETSMKVFKSIYTMDFEDKALSQIRMLSIIMSAFQDGNWVQTTSKVI